MNGCSRKLIKASRKTICDMLQDRGYTLNPSEETILQNDEVVITGHKKEETITVFYLLKKRMVPLLKEYIAKKKLTETDLCLHKHCVVTKHAVNKTFLTLCKQFNMENFNIHSLGINITNHILVPRHTLYSQENNSDVCAQIKEKLSLDSWEQLPLISVSDPVARYYAAAIGDIFKIDRYSKTGGRYISYRYVV